MRFRGHVFALTRANQSECLEIKSRTLVPRWSWEAMDDAMAVEWLGRRESVGGGRVWVGWIAREKPIKQEPQRGGAARAIRQH